MAKATHSNNQPHSLASRAICSIALICHERTFVRVDVSCVRLVVCSYAFTGTVRMS